MDRRGPRHKIQGNLLGVRAGEWVIIIIGRVLVNRGWKVKVVLDSRNGVWLNQVKWKTQKEKNQKL